MDRRLTLACLGSLAFGAATARAQTAGSRGLRLLVGSGPGGGYDTYARLVAQFLGKDLSGSPTVIVENMPGAGGLKLANYMAQAAPRDGSAIAITDRNLIAAPVLGTVDPDNIKFDAAKFIWLANLNSDVSFVIMRPAANVRSIEDLRRRQILVGSAGPTDNNGIFPYILNHFLGTRFKVVTGYPSSRDMALAMDRGEIDGVVGFSWASLKAERPNWLREGSVRLLLQLGLKPLPAQPDVPLLLSLAENAKQREALEFLATLNTLGRPFFAPPGLPDAAVSSLREGFARLVQDKAFVAQSERQKIDVAFTDGAAVQRIVERLVAIGPEVTPVIRQAIRPDAAPVRFRRKT